MLAASPCNGRPLRIAFLGLGRRGLAHLATCAQLPDFQPTHLCDRSPSALARGIECARGFAWAGIAATGDYRQVLADPALDAVCIATPAPCHAPMALAACAAGKDVYLETPACLTAAEGDALIQAVRQSGRIVQAGAVERSGATFQQVRHIVQSGRLGPVAYCRIARLESLDLVHFAFLDPEPLSVTAQRGGHTAHATLRYPGLIVSFEPHAIAPGEGASFHGTRATLVVEGRACRLHPAGGGACELESAHPEALDHLAHWRDWLECIRTRRQPASSVVAAVRTGLARRLCIQ